MFRLVVLVDLVATGGLAEVGIAPPGPLKPSCDPV